MIKLIFKLVKVARAKGGDRYECTVKDEPRPMVIYIPQYISRTNNKPFQEVELTITPKR